MRHYDYYKLLYDFYFKSKHKYSVAFLIAIKAELSRVWAELTTTDQVSILTSLNNQIPSPHLSLDLDSDEDD